MFEGPFSRDDTLFGICQALAEDFGFNASILRALIGAGLLFSPIVTIIAYAAAAVLVIISRWLVPDPVIKPDSAEPSAAAAANEDETEPQLPLAA